MKKLSLVLLLSCFSLNLFAQNLFSTAKGTVSFYSDAPLEDIQADNVKTAAIINAETNEMAVQMRVIDFEFSNKLMQEHFNENYLESEKFPTSVFKGKIKEQADLTVAGRYQVTAEGTLTMHGVTHQVLIPGTIVSDGKQLKLDFKFPVKLEDYKIEIPTIVFSKIAEIVDVSGSMVLVKK
ncbi:YceI family protein [Algoriphagus winogradskyi]|uniref:YceI-like domain-containing protein n=1 Tax=Algoriphagus winogradskyi TaxID=237017 RepID=A0ABY1NEX2_9BACT|nr:YceI family protein [Algoriphagus winogradskyi]SMP07207.1 YceI-like domain-containing protein [Algoriphagus winogradskyi]